MIKRVGMIVIIVAVALGGGYGAFRLILPASAEDEGPVYATAPVVRGDISVSVEASGPLNPSRGGGMQAPGGYKGGMAPDGGQTSFVVEEVFVEEGDAVQEGQVVVRFRKDETLAQIRTQEDKVEADQQSLARLMGVAPDKLDGVDPSQGITLRSPIGGRIVGLTAKEGQEIKQGQIVARVVDDTRFRMTAKLAPTEFYQVKLDQKLVLAFEGFSGFVDGEVAEVNPDPVLEDSSKLVEAGGAHGKPTGYQFVYWVTVEGQNPGLICPGMLARVGVLVEGSEPVVEGLPSANFLRYLAAVDGYVNEEQILSGADAMATRVYVHEMQKVKPGDALVALAGDDAQRKVGEMIDQLRQEEAQLQRLQTQLGELEVKAPMDGVVGYIEAQPGMSFEAGQWFGHLFNTSDMDMWVEVDDVDVLLVKQGAPVRVTVDALPGRSFEGKVRDVSMSGTDESGITRFQVSINVKGSPELRPGMQANAHIDVGSAQDVLLVPLEAIFEEDGVPKVEILLENGQTKVVTVDLGLMNDRVAEVKSGLKEGDLAITGSTADLLPSQTIKSEKLLPTKPSDGDGDEGDGGTSPGGSK